MESFQKTWLKVILVDLKAIFWMHYKKLNGRMGCLCLALYRKLNKQLYIKGGSTKETAAREPNPAHKGISSGRTNILSK